MPKPKKNWVMPLTHPCPCGSGLSILDCQHLDPTDNRLRKIVPSLRPPPPKTGLVQMGCYLGITMDCSEKISAEHPVSKSVLQQLGEKVRISGADWLKEGEYLETTAGNLTAKVLCKRHNESLSPLDSEAGIFFEALVAASTDLKRKTLSRKPIVHLVSGEALELWMLKLACGIYFGFGSSGRKRVNQYYEIALDKVEAAFFERQWDSRAGLYARAAVGESVKVQQNVRVAPILNEKERRFVGVIAILRGLQLELFFDTANLEGGLPSGLVRRPTELVWRRGDRQHLLILTWPIGTPNRSITFMHVTR